MCHSPVVLSVIGSEEAVVNTISHLLQRPGNGFAEAFLVTQFVDQLLAGNEDSFSAEERQLVDRS